ncbi:MAG: hypothetical protein IT245_02445 [Bacteroidia bacterium]|nr:hypothetical protein [Bacteroidia bacterium]
MLKYVSIFIFAVLWSANGFAQVNVQFINGKKHYLGLKIFENKIEHNEELLSRKERPFFVNYYIVDTFKIINLSSEILQIKGILHKDSVNYTYTPEIEPNDTGYIYYKCLFGSYSRFKYINVNNEFEIQTNLGRIEACCLNYVYVNNRNFSVIYKKSKFIGYKFQSTASHSEHLYIDSNGQLLALGHYHEKLGLQVGNWKRWLNSIPIADTIFPKCLSVAVFGYLLKATDSFKIEVHRQSSLAYTDPSPMSLWSTPVFYKTRNLADIIIEDNIDSLKIYSKDSLSVFYIDFNAMRDWNSPITVVELLLPNQKYYYEGSVKRGVRYSPNGYVLAMVTPYSSEIFMSEVTKKLHLKVRHSSEGQIVFDKKRISKRLRKKIQDNYKIAYLSKELDSLIYFTNCIYFSQCDSQRMNFVDSIFKSKGFYKQFGYGINFNLYIYKGKMIDATFYERYMEIVALLPDINISPLLRGAYKTVITKDNPDR